MIRHAAPVLLPLVLVPLAAQEAPLAAQEQAPARTLPTRELQRIAVAYAAKVTASAVFVSGRTVDSVLAQEFSPDTPMIALIRPLLRLSVDEERRTATARILDLSATAAFVPGLGCTLVHDVTIDALRARAQPIPATRPDERPWPHGQGDPVAPPAGVDAEALHRAIDLAFAETSAKGKPLRTRAVLVVLDGELIAERYADGFAADMALPGWSMSKTWVAALLGRRIREGELDRAAELPFAEWPEGDPRRRLRIDDLLHMHSGLAWKDDQASADSDTLRMLFADPDAAMSPAQKELAAEPGTEFRYSNGTTNLLCRVLRSTFASDAEHLAWPRRALFQPLGMRSAVLEPDPHGTFVGSSFGFATARDWARFGQFLLQDGVWNGERLLPEGWVAEMRTPADSAPRGNYGMHLWLNRGRQGDEVDRPFPKLSRGLFHLAGHEGQYVVCMPEEGLVVVRLGCSERGALPLQDLLVAIKTAVGR